MTQKMIVHMRTAKEIDNMSNNELEKYIKELKEEKREIEDEIEYVIMIREEREK